MEFILETEAGEQTAEGVALPLMVRKIIARLDGLDDGRLVNATRLSEIIGSPKKTMQQHTAHPALKPYRIAVGYNAIYYGSRKTVEAWNKEKGGADAG